MDLNKDARLTYDEFKEGSKQDPTIVQVRLSPIPRLERHVLINRHCPYTMVWYKSSFWEREEICVPNVQGPEPRSRSLGGIGEGLCIIIHRYANDELKVYMMLLLGAPAFIATILVMILDFSFDFIDHTLLYLPIVLHSCVSIS